MFLQSCRKLTHLSQKLFDQRTWSNNKMPKELRVNFSYIEFNHNLIKIFIK
jgi:hypothetical protein